jgi:hypothetical protein
VEISDELDETPKEVEPSSNRVVCPACLKRTMYFGYAMCMVPPNRFFYKCENPDCGLSLSGGDIGTIIRRIKALVFSDGKGE